MSQLRIFSYLPNPRIWKATVAARLCGVDVEVRGSSPQELQSWLWDFDARPLASDEHATSADVRVGKVGFQGASLRKTDAFMEAHPFGKVSRVLETVGGGNTPPDSSPAASPRPKSTAEAQRDRLLKRVEAGGIEPPS